MGLGRDRLRSETFECVDERMCEALQAITVLDDALSFNFVEDLANLLRSKFVVIQV
jgi:hypothetical protein